MSASVPEHELFDVTIVRNLQQSVPPADTETAQFNPAVFWSINAVWITLLIAVAVWIWKFHGAQRLSSWSQSLMAQDSGEQGNEETQQQTIPPEKRRKLLSDYFRTSRVHMVSKFDIGFSIAFLRILLVRRFLFDSNTKSIKSDATVYGCLYCRYLRAGSSQLVCLTRESDYYFLLTNLHVKCSS